MISNSIRHWHLVIALAALTVGWGCASKGFVRETVAPVDRRVNEVEQQTADNSTKIEGLESQLERDVSRLDERTQSNERAAEDASTQAQDAGKKAAAARDVAETGLARVEGLERSVDERFENFDDYRLAANETVLFKLGSSELTDEAMAQLDAASENIAGVNRYVVEIRGYTDTTGPESYNLTLSRRRAEAVVRYLTVIKNIPLHRIHVIGLGDEEPASDNSTREGRQQNRRVEMKLYVANVKDRAALARTE